MKDGFISVACGAPKLRLADCAYNAEQTFQMMRSAEQAGVKVLVCDKRGREDFDGLIEALERRGMTAALGPDYLDRLEGADGLGRNYYCGVYQDFFSYALPRLQRALVLLKPM